MTHKQTDDDRIILVRLDEMVWFINGVIGLVVLHSNSFVSHSSLISYSTWWRNFSLDGFLCWCMFLLHKSSLFRSKSESGENNYGWRSIKIRKFWIILRLRYLFLFVGSFVSIFKCLIWRHHQVMTTGFQMNFDQCGSILVVHIFYMKSAVLGSHSSDPWFSHRFRVGRFANFTCDQVPHLSY